MVQLLTQLSAHAVVNAVGLLRSDKGSTARANARLVLRDSAISVSAAQRQRNGSATAAQRQPGGLHTFKSLLALRPVERRAAAHSERQQV